MIIYITGYARSGTTLLRRLFYSFKDVHVYDFETPIYCLEENHQNIIVYKSDRYSPLSNLIITSMEQEETLLKELKQKGIKIINILRNGKQVYGNKTFADPVSWVNCIDHYIALKHYIDFNVYYRDLQTIPDTIQNQIANCFNLEIKHKFSDYPQFVPDDVTYHEGFMGRVGYELRPIENTIKYHTDWKSDVPKHIMPKFLKYCNMIDKHEL